MSGHLYSNGDALFYLKGFLQVHGARADELVCSCDEVPITEAAWVASADRLVKRKGLSYVSSLANDMNSNVTKQEACKIAIESM